VGATSLRRFSPSRQVRLNLIECKPASAVTAAMPTAQSVSEAKPTISAILATRRHKLIPRERIPSSSRRFRRGHEPCGELVPLSSPIAVGTLSVSQRIRRENF
jgi:hypothetical protein